MRAMILRCLIGASVFSATALLAVGSAQANPIDDCNQSDDAEKQIDGCTEFLQLDPFSPYVALAYGRRAEAYMRKGDLARAVADFDQAVAIDGSQARLYVGRGLAYRDKGELDKAIGDFSKAIELDSKFGEAFINRCVVYEDKGQADLAIADCTAAIAINPKDAVALTIAASLARRQGRSKARLPTTARPSSSTPAIATLTPTVPCFTTTGAKKIWQSPITAPHSPRIPPRKTARILKLH